jgi:hypothetical protein
MKKREGYINVRERKRKRENHAGKPEKMDSELLEQLPTDD